MDINEDSLPGEPTARGRKIGSFIFFIAAMLTVLIFELRLTGIDAFSAKGPEITQKIGGEKFLLILGKCFFTAILSSRLGVWGFSFPRLYLIGVVTGIFALIGGPLIWGSIHSMFWESSIGPTIIVISGLSFFLGFLLMIFNFDD